MASVALSPPYLPFDASSEVWRDITPVYQDDAALKKKIVPPTDSDAMNLYRSLIRSAEHSPRALALTEHLIRLNAANYSIWQYRAAILLSSSPEQRDSRLRQELDWLDILATENMKNYQVWQHRRLIVTFLGDPSRELTFIATALAKDAKNYHTWVYRQWFLCHFGGLTTEQEKATSTSEPGRSAFPELWDGELDYASKLLDDDIRNNSAWNHRYFVLFATGRARSLPEGEEVWAKQEMGYTKAKLASAPNNPSAWNYLRGLLRHISYPSPYALNQPFAISLVPTSSEAQSDPGVDEAGSAPIGALEWLFDAAEEAILAAKEGTSLQDAEVIIDRLQCADPIRTRYWAYRLSVLRRAANPVHS